MYYDYVQKHKIEIVQAEKIAKMLNVSNTLLNISAFTQLNDSALINSELDISSTHKKSQIYQHLLYQIEMLYFLL